MRIVAALGGNALLKRRETPDAETLTKNVGAAADAIAEIATSHEIVVTHGNGPQIGLLALQSEAYPDVPPYPLDILGAETEGMIGYLIERELRNRLPGREIATLLTQVEVASDDPAFAHPTKPIGPVYDAETAQRLARKYGWTVAADGDGFRRVVPSPVPQRIVQIEPVRRLLETGVLVICAGGGGVPVTVTESGALHGVEAVVDKDLASASLAVALDAEVLLLLTDVDGVYADFGGKNPHRIRSSSPELLGGMPFDAGSMGPKVSAACDFAIRTGGTAAIGSLEQATQILAGDAGTLIRHGLKRQRDHTSTLGH